MRSGFNSLQGIHDLEALNLPFPYALVLPARAFLLMRYITFVLLYGCLLVLSLSSKHVDFIKGSLC